MKIKFALTIGAGFFLLLLFFPLPALADGMIIPPYPWRAWETGQKAVVWFENGQETLILSTTFRGDTADFGWIIPAPAKPEVEKGSDEIFTSLQELTQPQYRVYETKPDVGFGLKQAPMEEAVTVVETKKVDIYEISVVTSTESEALAEWFAKNDYPYPASQAYILDEYIKKGWYFIAAKIDTEKLGAAVQGQLREGHATPLMIKFKTEKIIYPLKISSITGELYESDVIYQQGFNSSTGGWMTNDTGKIDPTQAYEGRGSLEVKKPTLQKDVEIHRLVNNFTKNREYTLSAYLKADKDSSGSAYLQVGQASLISRSEPVTLSDQWQRLTLTFTAQAKSYRTKIIGQGFDPVDSFNVDAIQVELGSKATPYEPTAPPSSPTKPPPRPLMEPGITIESAPLKIAPDYYPRPTQERVEVLLYVFDLKKKVEIPGFNTEYAGWVRPKEIEKLAFDGQGEPLLPTKRKMYLTKLHRSMTQSEMTNDLYPRLADKNRAVGRGSSIAVEPWVVVLIFGVPLVAEIGFFAWLFSRRKEKK